MLAFTTDLPPVVFLLFAFQKQRQTDLITGLCNTSSDFCGVLSLLWFYNFIYVLSIFDCTGSLLLCGLSSSRRECVHLVAVWGLLIQILSLCLRPWEPQLLSSCAATTEGHTPWNLCSTTREDTAMRSPHTTRKSSPHSLKLEKTHAQQKTVQPKINEIIKINSLKN